MVTANLWEENDNGTYVVEAGENRTGRMRYVVFYKDSNDISISVVPAYTKNLNYANKVKQKAEEKYKVDGKKFDVMKYRFNVKKVD